MRKKDGTSYIVVATLLLALASPVEAQQLRDNLPLIGYLANEHDSSKYSREAFQQGMRAVRIC
jgi:hypothetical protein